MLGSHAVMHKRMDLMMKSVVQEEITGCGIASVANILGKNYSEMKSIANAVGIYASDAEVSPQITKQNQ